MKLKLAERIWISDRRKVERLKKLVYDLAHFRNLTLIFIREYHRKTGKWITSASVLYSLFADRMNRKSGEEKRRKVEEIKKNLDEGLKEWYLKILEQKRKIDNNWLVQQVLRQIESDFKSYFSSIKEYRKNPKKFCGEPKPPKPKKLQNLPRFTVEFNANVMRQNGRKLYLRLRVKGNRCFCIKLSRSFKVTSARLCYFLGSVYVDVIREEEFPDVKPLGNHIAAVDLNLDNFVVLVSTKPAVPSIIISGGAIKAFNQWFNKVKSKLQSEADRIRNEIEKFDEPPEELVKKERELRAKIRILCVHRKKWFDTHFHRLTKYLALFLYRTGHKTLIIGNGALNAKRGCNLGHKIAEKFVQIPYRSFIEKLRYKCQLLGIEVKEVSEENTSKINCLCDSPDARKMLSGQRIRRGLYLAFLKGKKVVLNADCNAAFNILRRGASLPNLTSILDPKVLMWKLCNPVKFKFFRFIELLQRNPRIPRGIGGSTAPEGQGIAPASLKSSENFIRHFLKQKGCAGLPATPLTPL
ncbi:MAG: RNA-guided endonuclease InsQ/TnpB family protein [Candidatus Baldrarchaeia archaeon]